MVHIPTSNADCGRRHGRACFPVAALVCTYAGVLFDRHGAGSATTAASSDTTATGNAAYRRHGKVCPRRCIILIGR